MRRAIVTMTLAGLCWCEPAAAATLDEEDWNVRAECPGSWHALAREGEFKCAVEGAEVLLIIRRDSQEYPGEMEGRSAYEVSASLVRDRLGPDAAVEVREDTDLPAPGRSQYVRLSVPGGAVYAYVVNRAVDPLERFAGRIVPWYPYTGRGYGYVLMARGSSPEPPAALTSVVASFEIRDERGGEAVLHGLMDLRGAALAAGTLLVMLLAGGITWLIGEAKALLHVPAAGMATLAGLLTVGSVSTVSLAIGIPPLWALGEAIPATALLLLAALWAWRHRAVHAGDATEAPSRRGQRKTATARPTQPAPAAPVVRPDVPEKVQPPTPSLAAGARDALDKRRAAASHPTAFMPPEPKKADRKKP